MMLYSIPNETVSLLFHDFARNRLPTLSEERNFLA